jgi:hypothetical protein
LKLSSSVDTIQPGKVGLILTTDQGQVNAMRHAGLIALGPVFQLHIERNRIMGTDLTETAMSIAHGREAKAGAGIMNMFKVTGRAQFCSDVHYSVRCAHNSWTITTSGPVQGLNAIDVDDHSGAVCNTFDKCTTNVQVESNRIGVMTFDGEDVRIMSNSGSKFKDAIDNQTNEMTYVRPFSSVKVDDLNGT